ncbi:hypothetical protein AAVH_32081, partial [Aphelenchoides avenae]
TEAAYLALCYLFDLGYRRVRWSCNVKNDSSKRAAERLGFTFEAVHPQRLTFKGVNTDRATYSMLDKEWPQTRLAFQKWLSAENQTGDGQKTSLS